jgi:predicted Zn-dependent protease with MMP-like domain
MATIGINTDTKSMDNIDSETFKTLVTAEFDALPDNMVEGCENIAFIIEDRPEDGSLNLLGLYNGVALTRRGQYGFGELPDRIILYREPLLAISKNEDDLRKHIHITLVHEIGHFYGLNDARLHELGWD